MNNPPRFGYTSSEVSADQKNLGMLKDARDADLASAVRREQASAKAQGFPLSPAEAKSQVLERIGTEGVANILPQYAKIRTRMGISDDVDLGDESRPVKIHTATQFEQPEPSTAPNLDAMRETITKGKAAGMDTSDSEALLAHLESNPN